MPKIEPSHREDMNRFHRTNDQKFADLTSILLRKLEAANPGVNGRIKVDAKSSHHQDPHRLHHLHLIRKTKKAGRFSNDRPATP